jgi:DNA-binding HxlR family transcriptional regulator
MGGVPDNSCSIARSLGVLGERWTLLILRDAFDGMTRFAEFRKSLGVASDVLSDRLGTLVEYGVLRKAGYQEPGERRRDGYQLTEAGHELLVVLGALQQWGDRHLPRPQGPSIERRDRRTGEAVHVGFVDEHGSEVPAADLRMDPTPSYPPERLAVRRPVSLADTP